ncbi:MAG: transglycosylase domain-containing protein, partial [Lachnospiraceae bacterium]|nr:transglycosylase domain-containing protein [Lachnospiraceae bacterium]
MNYGKRGISKIQKSLTSKSIKFQKLFFVTALKLILIGTLSLMIVGVCLGIGMFKGILSTAPDVDPAAVLPQGFATVVYDAKGNELTKLVAANSNRSYEEIDKIPQYLCDAFVAIEDERFYEHNGIDIKRIMSAGFMVLRDRKLSQGASTITQQIIKNNVFDNWTNESDIQKIKRKIQEQYLALELEKKMSKEKILEIYMNTINLGQNT